MSTKIRGFGFASRLVVCAVAASSEPAGAASVPVPPRSVRIAPGNGVRPFGGTSLRQRRTDHAVRVACTQTTRRWVSSCSTSKRDHGNDHRPQERLRAHVQGRCEERSRLEQVLRVVGRGEDRTPLPVGKPTVVPGKAQATVSWHAATANGASVDEYRVTPLYGHERPADVFKSAKTREWSPGCRAARSTRSRSWRTTAAVGVSLRSSRPKSRSSSPVRTTNFSSWNWPTSRCEHAVGRRCASTSRPATGRCVTPRVGVRGAERLGPWRRRDPLTVARVERRSGCCTRSRSTMWRCS